MKILSLTLSLECSACDGEHIIEVDDFDPTATLEVIAEAAAEDDGWSLDNGTCAHCRHAADTTDRKHMEREYSASR